MPEGPQCGDAGTKTPIDLSLLVANSRRLVVLADPFIQLGRVVISLQRWQSPRTSLCVLLLSNVACFCLSTGHLLLYLLLFIVSCASLGIIHNRTGLLKKCFPNPPPCQQNSDEDSHSCNIEEFKDLLVHVNTFLELSCWFLTRLYEILKWNTGYYAVMFYSAFATVVVVLNLLPLRCSVNLTVAVFFLHQPVSLYVKSWTAPKCEITANDSNKEEQTQVTTARVTSRDTGTMDVIVTQVTSQRRESYKEVEMSEDKLQDDDASEQCADSSASADMSDGDNAVARAARTEVKEGTAKGSGVMGKILDFKQRRQQRAAVGSCIGCTVNFSTILKRRHKCSNCGNYFCGQCCSSRVPKSLLGVTAPGSQSLMVPVCHFCHKFLTASQTDS